MLNITPIILSYKLDAGQRESGLITKYYGPVSVNSSPAQEVPTRGLAAGNDADDNPMVKIEKSTDKFLAKPGEMVNFTVGLWLNGAGERVLHMRDYLPDSFSPAEVEHAVQSHPCH